MNQPPLVTDTERLNTLLTENSGQTPDRRPVRLDTERSPIMTTNVSILQDIQTEDDKTILLNRFFM